MTSPEDPRPAEEDPDKEQQSPLFYLASRFPQALLSQQVYSQAQDTVFRAREKCDLSAYRFQLPQIYQGYYVTVLGESPPEKLLARLQGILAAGESTTLPEDALKFLQERRAQASKLGPWVEGHYRPGKGHHLK